ncbi:voltage-gated potassium channel [Neocallimastix californiae]|uniref:Voltage-gated potassium channel n=1 Tax=Neocallimastix californiae TaxID=1754190 RepID=A0A1Y2AQJ1_9FUNG|nr:voltage-gated potassium channel [Neocallimastix californiae]|eukprot:ORY24744.1 voltage-gated potassium channel [Neocallimastix californiae]
MALKKSSFIDKAIHKLYNDDLCSKNQFLNIINYINFFFIIGAIYVLYISTLPQYHSDKKDEDILEIVEIAITTYLGVDLLLRYILYTFFSITINGREKEFDKYFNRNKKNDIDYTFITMSGGTGKGVSHSKRQREILTSSVTHYFKFFKSKIEINNLISITPYFIELIFPKLSHTYSSYLNWISTAIRYTRIFRFIYYFYNTRIVKICQMSSLLKVLRNSVDGLITVTILVLWTTMFFTAFFFFAETYDCEFDKVTEKYYRVVSNKTEECLVNSIIDSYWWGVVTTACIGYGDTTPVTAQGKIVVGFTIIFAIMIFPIPSSILTIEFMEFLVQLKKNETIENAVKECEKKIEKALGGHSGMTHLQNARNDPVSIKNLFKDSNKASSSDKNKNITGSSELLSDSTTTIKYALSKQLMTNKDPEIEELNRIIQDQKNLHQTMILLKIKNIGHSRKNSQGKIEVDINMGEVKYMSVGEISKELYKLSMEYYAFCDNEIGDVDEQTGTLYLLMNGLDKTINLVNALRRRKT